MSPSGHPADHPLFMRLNFHLSVLHSLPNKFFVLDQIHSICRQQINVAKIMISVSDQVENIVGKGENAGYQHFFFSQNVFKRLLALSN